MIAKWSKMVKGFVPRPEENWPKKCAPHTKGWEAQIAPPMVGQQPAAQVRKSSGWHGRRPGTWQHKPPNLLAETLHPFKDTVPVSTPPTTAQAHGAMYLTRGRNCLVRARRPVGTRTFCRPLQESNLPFAPGVKGWSLRWDSNPLPLAYGASALPN